MDVGVVDGVGLGGLTDFSRGWEVVPMFLEGRPRFLPSWDSVFGRTGLVVFPSFFGLPLFLGSASFTGESVRTGFNRVMEMLPLISPNWTEK